MIGDAWTSERCEMSDEKCVAKRMISAKVWIEMWNNTVRKARVAHLKNSLQNAVKRPLLSMVPRFGVR